MIFCGIELMPGQKERVPLPVPGAQSLDTVCLCGAALGKTLVVTAGVHGCEYVGVKPCAVWRQSWTRRSCPGT